MLVCTISLQFYEIRERIMEKIRQAACEANAPREAPTRCKDVS